MDARTNVTIESSLILKKFISREKEQKAFVEAFRHIVNRQLNTPPPSSHSVSRLFLVNGQGGLGKTSLLSRFIQICRDVDQTSEPLVLTITYSHNQIDYNFE